MKKPHTAKLEALLRKTAKYRAVALDVFGTLLRRDVPQPTAVFDLVGKGFRIRRIAAEQSARAAHTGEVTLAQIYAQPQLVGEDPAHELAAERSVLAADALLLEFARQCHARGQQVYAVSDMYLSAQDLAALLVENGFDFLDGIFVSSEYGVQKRSGKLFHVFLQKTGLRANEVVMVGDDLRADVLGAALAGISAIHWRFSPSAETNLLPPAWQAFGANHMAALQGEAERLGFAVLGPLLVGFAAWLHTQYEKAPGGRLYFLARDMYLVQAVYRLLYPEQEGNYLQVSRRSLCPALLAQHAWQAAVQALPRQTMNGAQIAAYLGTSCPPALCEKTCDLKSETGRQQCADLLAQLVPPDAEPVLGYLQQVGLQQGDWVVDIGSGGTTQQLLQQLCGVNLQGAYLACDARLHQALPPEHAAVYLFNGQPAPVLYWAAQPMLERLLSQDVGATLGYASRGERWQVRHAPCVPDQTIAAMQRGALHFAACWQKSWMHETKISADLAIHPFMQLFSQPTRAQCKLLGTIEIEDGETTALAAPQPLRRYVVHPGQLRRDFAQSRWKIGFLKGLLRLPLRYDALYQKLKQHP